MKPALYRSKDVVISVCLTEQGLTLSAWTSGKCGKGEGWGGVQEERWNK